MSDKPRRHKWDHSGEDRLAGHDQPDGCARNARRCLVCKLVKVTVIPPPGFPVRHEWITPDGQKWEGEATPPCLDVPEVKAELQGVA